MLMSIGTSKELGGGQLSSWGKDEKRINKMCFIGRNLDRKELYDSLLACIDDGKAPAPGKPPTELPRFKVGTKVLCNVGTWETGKVVKIWYREEYWETGRFAPYQVKVNAYSMCM